MDDVVLKGSCHCESVTWKYQSLPQNLTACNCTVCRRYGVLWAYGYKNDTIYTQGQTQTYIRGDKHLAFHFCSDCGCVAYWQSLNKNEQGKLRIAVNMRLIDDPERIEHLPVRHFEGLHSFSALPSDGKTVKDVWF